MKPISHTWPRGWGLWVAKHLWVAKQCQNPFPNFDLSFSPQLSLTPMFQTLYTQFYKMSSTFLFSFSWFYCSLKKNKSTLLRTPFLCSWSLLSLLFSWKYPSESSSYITLSVSFSPVLTGRINYHSIFNVPLILCILFHIKVGYILSTFTLSLDFYPSSLNHTFKFLLWSRKPGIHRHIMTLEVVHFLK